MDAGKWQWIQALRSKIFRRGHWEWEHEFKTCPTGDRHCMHYRWVRDP